MLELRETSASNSIPLAADGAMPTGSSKGVTRSSSSSAVSTQPSAAPGMIGIEVLSSNCRSDHLSGGGPQWVFSGEAFPSREVA